MKHQGVCDDPNCPLKKFERQAKARAAGPTVGMGQLYVNGEPIGGPVPFTIETKNSSRSEEERRQRTKQP
jgi:hypothetical protein